MDRSTTQEPPHTDGAEESAMKGEWASSLTKLHYQYTDSYFMRVGHQAGISFNLAVFSAILGLVLLVTGIVMALFGKTAPSVVTACAGVLTNFLSAAEFFLYKQTIARMAEYQSKLFLSQNVAIALSAANSLDQSNKEKAYLLVIESLVKDVNHLIAAGPSKPEAKRKKAKPKPTSKPESPNP